MTFVDRALHVPAIPVSFRKLSMRLPISLLVLTLFAGCDDPVGPTLPPAGSYALVAGGTAVAEPESSPLQPVPFTFDPMLDGQCVVTTQSGSLVIEGDTYSLRLDFDRGCPARALPAVLEETGMLRIGPSRYHEFHFMPVGYGLRDDVPPTWLSTATEEGGEILVDVVQPYKEGYFPIPYLGAPIHLFRFRVVEEK